MQLNTSAELRVFEAVTESNDWMSDPINNPYGARMVSISVLVDDRKELLRQIVSQEVLAELHADAERPTPDAEANAAAEPAPPNEEQPATEE